MRDDLKEQRIRDAEDIRRFLTNDAVKRAFEAQFLSLFTEWKQTTDPVRCGQLHAEARALDGFWVTLQATVDSGERDQAELDPRATRPEPLA